ncbi:TonB-dependent receptor [Paraglaciecola arctica]|uniref:TonB-dependent receptor n=1 Tax=Paraglaciecola arctica TaxID=1128911 RepID=UPI001C07EBD2|nr:TonB-dependent receptor [Paraglaciecola arctica]MBU3004521.1 TonB-dependent receptor [Paraglaciecola arctica]
MFYSTHQGLRRTVISSVIASVLCLPIASAQQADTSEPDKDIERIFVTASKRPLTLQDTPIAVSVTSAQDIEQAKVVDVLDMQTLVPSLKVLQTSLTTVSSFSIRGFGSSSNNIGTEPSVGVFIDGVFRSRASGAITDLPKLERVEVLSGPQSTLFGKNASAGVVSVVTSAPSFVTEGRVEATLGNYNQRLLKGYVTGGVSDELALSFAAGINKRDGYTKALYQGVTDPDNRDRWNLRGQALWEPSADVTFRAIVDYSEIDEICCSSPNVISGPVDNVVLALGGSVLDASDPFARESVLIESSTNEVEDGGLSLHLDVDYDDFTLTSISAYRLNTLVASNPVGSSSIETSRSVRDIEITAFSQEIRLTSSSEGPFNWILGGFLYDEDIVSTDALEYGPDLRNFVNYLTGGGLVAVESALGFPQGTFYPDGIAVAYAEGQDNRDFSVFASTDYEFTDALTGTVGLNYTNDKKEAYVTEVSNEDVFSSINFNTLAGGAFAGLAAAQFRPPIVSYPNSLEDGKSDDSDTTYLVRLAYKHNENFNFYISQATGFKSSAWDLTNFSRPDRAIADALDASGENSSNPIYGSRLSTPEYATVTEIGMKVWYRNFQANVAIFDQSIEDFQVRSFDGVDFFQANAGKTSVDGMEFDLRYSVTDNLAVTFAGTLLDPVYDDFSNAPPGPNSPRDADGNYLPQDLSGTRPLNIHEKSLVAGVVYTASFDTADLYIRADYSYESSLVFAPAGTITTDNPDFTRQVNNLGASAGVNFGNGMSMQLWGRNLTDDENLLGVFGQPGQTGTVGAFINQPRTYGVSVAYEF